jgi:single-strand DNA-binding protein
VNKVILVGNLGADPEVRYLPSGEAVANIRIATTDTWKDKDGNKQEATEWHRVSFFGRQAEVCRPVPEEGLADLCRRLDPHPQMAGQGRPGPLLDRDRGDRMQMLGGRQGMSDAPPRESAGAGSAAAAIAPRRSRPAAPSMISRTIFRSDSSCRRTLRGRRGTSGRRRLRRRYAGWCRPLLPG